MPKVKTRDELKEELGQLLALPSIDRSEADRIRELGKELDAYGIETFDAGTAEMVRRAGVFPLWRVIGTVWRL
jgi:hypothetical protein